MPDQVPEFISQRRRWLNGSFFAAVYSLWHIFQLGRTEHSRWKALALYFQGVYNLLNLVFAWFSMANYVRPLPPVVWCRRLIPGQYIFFILLSSSLEDPSLKMPKAIRIVNLFLQVGHLPH